MSNRETNFKEKLRQALTSTVRVISDDLEIEKKSEINKNSIKNDFFEIENLNNRTDFIRARAESDSSALKKKFSDDKIYKMNLPYNTGCRSLYAVAEKIRYETPNISGRMDHLRASILRPQLRHLNAQCKAWNVRYKTLENGLKDTPGLRIIQRPIQEAYVGSSIQFLLLDWNSDAIGDVIERCAARGVELKWFGSKEPVGFTSRYDSWTYVQSSAMPKSDRILAGLLDMRIPLTFSIEDCVLIANIVRSEIGAVYQNMSAMA